APAAAVVEVEKTAQTVAAQTPVVSDVQPASRQAPVAAPVAETAQFTAADVAPAAAVSEVETFAQPVTAQIPVVSDAQSTSRQATVASPAAETAQFVAAVPAVEVAQVAAVKEKEKSVQSAAAQVQVSPDSTQTAQQTQVAVPVAETSQPESVQAAPVTQISNEIVAGQSDVSSQPNRTRLDVQPAAANESVATSGSAAGVALASQESVSAQAQSVSSAKTQPAAEEIKTSQASPVSENSTSAAKQPETPTMVEPMPVLTTPAMEAVSVKDAGKLSTAQINAQAADVVQQIMRHMNAKISTGPSSMRLQLNPKELGAIDVQMVSNAQGVSVTFFAEQGSTRQLLETQINQLRQSLTDSGVQLTGLNIGQHGQSGQEGGFSNQSQQFVPYTQPDVPQAEIPVKESLRPERIAGSTTEVDYLI
ncbi:MAG: flagellar hook-length control protein FliK, partial [Chloroflexi bacterium]|nr:flagellar hook-length control protein FliK [Chloroflexota bacterium]